MYMNKIRTFRNRIMLKDILAYILIELFAFEVS